MATRPTRACENMYTIEKFRLATTLAFIVGRGAIVIALVGNVASINVYPLPPQFQWHLPTVEIEVLKVEVAPWTLNCLATSTFLTAFRTPRTATSDAVAGGSWLVAASVLQSFPVGQAVAHADNITRRQALVSLLL